jgi:pyridoxamine 5'-phosphate oxidase
MKLHSDLMSDPLAEFEKWLSEAKAAGIPQHDAMTLATVTPEGGPSARMVLYKGISRTGKLPGFSFFTHYESRKGRELENRAEAALVFFWAELDRQIRVIGSVEKTTAAESDAYWISRHRISRLGAVASHQGGELASREELEAKVAALAARYPGEDIPRPAHWGGYRVVPRLVEFWIGRPNRLHDRFLYEANGTRWKVSRLSP